jgi:GGDEF domain-containing protein
LGRRPRGGRRVDGGENVGRLKVRARQSIPTVEVVSILTRQFFEDLAREFASARRYRDSLSLLLIDLDDLKHLNELEGFEAGDELLRKVAETLLTRLRVTDIAARIGGDSFAVILTRTNAEGARAISERLPAEIGARVAIGDLDFGAPLDLTQVLGELILQLSDLHPPHGYI